MASGRNETLVYDLSNGAEVASIVGRIDHPTLGATTYAYVVNNKQVVVKPLP